MKRNGERTEEGKGKASRREVGQHCRGVMREEIMIKRRQMKQTGETKRKIRRGKEGDTGRREVNQECRGVMREEIIRGK